jgi:lipopolysaccharide transport system ATP-binding protein
MYVRLAFAVAAHLDPEILVVDEVLAVGDAEFQKKCLGKMGDISKKEGRTVLFVSHNMAAVRQLCDRGILLEGGEVLYEDKTEKLVDYYEASVFERTENKWSTTLRPSGMGQDVFIKRAESFNENNEKASTFFFGEKIGLAIEIESPFQSFKDLSIGVRFETAGDVYIASCLSQDSNSLFSVEPEGASKIKVSFEKFYLTPGTYFLTFSIRKGKMLYDQVVKALRFTVLDFSKDKVLVHNKAWGFLKINSFWSKDVE